MKAPILALCFMSVLVENTAHRTAHVGESVSLECLCKDGAEVMSYWYKQILGRSPTLMSAFYKYTNSIVFEDEFTSSRFSLDTGNDGKLMLKMSDLRTSDSATYFCALSDLYNFDFCEGTTVIVKGSDLSFQTLVHQSESDTMKPEVPETLKCAVHTGTCDGEQGFYWFKDANEVHPGLIHSPGGRTDQCERKGDAQTHTCVYNLPLKNLNVSGNGIHSCAVASCGRMLFGNGSRLDSNDEVEFLVPVYVLSGALAFTTILTVLLAFSGYKLSKGHCLDAATSPSTQLSQDGEDLHYAAVGDYKANKARRQKHDAYSECVYSSVKM